MRHIGRSKNNLPSTDDELPFPNGKFGLTTTNYKYLVVGVLVESGFPTNFIGTEEHNRHTGAKGISLKFSLPNAFVFSRTRRGSSPLLLSLPFSPVTSECNSIVKHSCQSAIHSQASRLEPTPFQTSSISKNGYLLTCVRRHL